MNVTIRQLQAFLAVAELGSFTRAGERLRLTQSAASLLVGDLERVLRVRLLDRTTRRVELTEAGRQFRAQAAKVMEDLGHAVRHAHGLSERRHGRIAVAAPPLLAATVLPHAIARHRTTYPGVEIVVFDCGTDQIVARVKAGDADLGIGTFPPDLEGLTRTRIARDQMMLFCPAGHRLARRRQVTWQDLDGEKVIALTRESGIRQLSDLTAQRTGISLPPAFEVAQIMSAMALAEAGLGPTILPAIARTLGRYPHLHARPLTRPVVTRAIEFAHRTGRSLPPAGLSLVEALRTELNRIGQRSGLSADGAA